MVYQTRCTNRNIVCRNETQERQLQVIQQYEDHVQARDKVHHRNSNHDVRKLNMRLKDK